MTDLRSAKNIPFSQIIVIGGTGQTGHRLLEFLVEMPQVQLFSTSREVSANLPAGPLSSSVLVDAQKWGSRVQWFPLNLETENEAVRSQLHSMAVELNPRLPTALVFAAAYTNVEGCEVEPEKCNRINVENTIEVLKWARQEFNSKLVFYSTDYVFDGQAGPYKEEVSRHAISQYGQSKVDVELWLEKNASDFLILRTTGVYDYLPGSKNFLMQMLELWGQGKSTKIPRDQFSNPVWAQDLARATLELLSQQKQGIYNVAGASYLARTEFAKEIAEIFSYDQTLMTPILTSDLGQKARRPLKGGLECSKLKAVLGWAPAAPKEVLERLKWFRKA